MKLLLKIPLPTTWERARDGMQKRSRPRLRTQRPRRGSGCVVHVRGWPEGRFSEVEESHEMGTIKEWNAGKGFDFSRDGLLLDSTCEYRNSPSRIDGIPTIRYDTPQAMSVPLLASHLIFFIVLLLQLRKVLYITSEIEGNTFVEQGGSISDYVSIFDARQPRNKPGFGSPDTRLHSVVDAFRLESQIIVCSRGLTQLARSKTKSSEKIPSRRLLESQNRCPGEYWAFPSFEIILVRHTIQVMKSFPKRRVFWRIIALDATGNTFGRGGLNDVSNRVIDSYGTCLHFCNALCLYLLVVLKTPHNSPFSCRL